ncbi:hypothetical protein KC460_02730 [Candidatus Dependentiae bacterium]|nr:hypothetical protein [Candidatus Dependentiae bacterium]
MVKDMSITEQIGWLDRVKSSLKIDTIMEKISASKDKIVELGIYLGAGFLIGFLLKKYAQYVIVFILLVVGITVLQQLGVLHIVINWEKIQELFGVQQTMVSSDVVNSYFEWVRLHIWLVLSFSIGFFFGLKVG